MKSDSSILIDTIRAYTSPGTLTSSISPTNQQIDLCLKYGLAPIVADLILQSDTVLNPKQKNILESIILNAKYRTAILNSAIQDFIKELSDTNITIVLLKGAAISRTHYKKPYHRVMGDIDFLVEKKYAEAVTHKLRALEYEQESHLSDAFFETHQHLKPFRNSEKNTWIEVHTLLFSRNTWQGSRKLFQPDNLFNSISALNSEYKNVYRLNNELNLSYTITHWVREFIAFHSLVQLIDIILLITDKSIDWDQFIDNIDNPSQATEVKVVMDILILNNIINLPREIKVRIYDKKDSAGLIGRWLMVKIAQGYLAQKQFIVSTVGSTNCARVWEAYLRDRSSMANHFHALSSLIFAKVPGTNSILSSFIIRLKKFLGRLANINN